MRKQVFPFIPSLITIASLACGVVSILLSSLGDLQVAGWLIIASYILDLLDGLSARKLDVASSFGLQLDSLVDMVSLGIAPTALVFHHLLYSSIDMAWVWPFTIIVAAAGAVRLARFNLLPAKETETQDTFGLTISTSGATIAVAVLADLAWAGGLLPDFAFILIMTLVSLLMVSTIRFPSIGRIVSNRYRTIVLVVLIGISLVFLPIAVTWLMWDLIYIAAGLVRAIYLKQKRRIGS
ncbi:MAG: CDP-alcohol phosphatidyltransferase family protein [Anaerolineales bacterium]